MTVRDPLEIQRVERAIFACVFGVCICVSALT